MFRAFERYEIVYWDSINGQWRTESTNNWFKFIKIRLSEKLLRYTVWKD